MSNDYGLSNIGNKGELNCRVDVIRFAIGRIIRIFICGFEHNQFSQDSYFSCDALVEEILVSNTKLLIIDGAEPLDRWDYLHRVISDVKNHKSTPEIKILIATNRSHQNASNQKNDTLRQQYNDFLASINWFITKKNKEDRGLWHPVNSSGIIALSGRGLGSNVDAELAEVINVYYPDVPIGISTMPDMGTESMGVMHGDVDFDTESMNLIATLTQKNINLNNLVSQTLAAHDEKEAECESLRDRVDELLAEIEQLKKTPKGGKTPKKDPRLQNENNELRNENQDLKVKLKNLLERNKTLNASLQESYSRNEDNVETIRRYEESGANLRDDMETLRELRKAHAKRAESYLTLCVGVQNWLEKRLVNKDALMSTDSHAEFNYDDFLDHVEDLSLVIEHHLNDFEHFEPDKDEPYYIDDHEIIGNSAGDSGNLYIEEVKSPGYKLDGRIIRKAKVCVYKFEEG